MIDFDDGSRSDNSGFDVDFARRAGVQAKRYPHIDAAVRRAIQEDVWRQIRELEAKRDAVRPD